MHYYRFVPEALVDYEGGDGRPPIEYPEGSGKLNPNTTAGIWAPYPQDYLTAQSGFGDNVSLQGSSQTGLVIDTP